MSLGGGAFVACWRGSRRCRPPGSGCPCRNRARRSRRAGAPAAVPCRRNKAIAARPLSPGGRSAPSWQRRRRAAALRPGPRIPPWRAVASQLSGNCRRLRTSLTSSGGSGFVSLRWARRGDFGPRKNFSLSFQARARGAPRSAKPWEGDAFSCRGLLCGTSARAGRKGTAVDGERRAPGAVFRLGATPPFLDGVGHGVRSRHGAAQCRRVRAASSDTPSR